MLCRWSNDVLLGNTGFIFISLMSGMWDTVSNGNLRSPTCIIEHVSAFIFVNLDNISSKESRPSHTLSKLVFCASYVSCADTLGITSKILSSPMSKKHNKNPITAVPTITQNRKGLILQLCAVSMFMCCVITDFTKLMNYHNSKGCLQVTSLHNHFQVQDCIITFWSSPNAFCAAVLPECIQTLLLKMSGFYEKESSRHIAFI